MGLVADHKNPDFAGPTSGRHVFAARHKAMAVSADKREQIRRITVTV